MSEKMQKKQLSNNEISVFCEQMSMILKSGISVAEGISIMAEDAPAAQGRALLEELYTSLEAHGSLYQAMKESGFFPPYAMHMCEIGEQSGRLDDVMDALAAYYRREEDISKSIKSAVAYPLMMIGMMLLIIFVLIVKVLPIFNQVFEDLGAQMSGISLTLMHAGAALGRYAFVFIAIAAVIIIAVMYLTLTVRGQRLMSAFGARFIGTKKLYYQIACGRFASGMAMTLKSGLDTDESLEMLARLVEQPLMQAKIKDCQQKIAEGADFAEALSETGIFSGIQARMVSIGFKTGHMDEVMQKVARQYEEDADSRISRMIAVLEPTLVVILSVITGFILLSVMLPLMSIMSNIG